MKQLLPIVDGFEQARTQVKADTEGEQKINNSYQVSCQEQCVTQCMRVQARCGCFHAARCTYVGPVDQFHDRLPIKTA